MPEICHWNSGTKKNKYFNTIIRKAVLRILKNYLRLTEDCVQSVKNDGISSKCPTCNTDGVQGAVLAPMKTSKR